MEGAVVVGTTFVSVATVSMRSSGSVVDIASPSSSFSVSSGGSIANISSAFDPRSDDDVVVAVEDEDDDDMAM